ncbi:zinc finger protein 385A-like isoform X1 [Salvelinus namaycush]|uniref:Zinc finger protein 385A-like isoform X1 n=2 Tax=Salvelinus namaycush TaxID=8040 RepID=A0A8U1C8Q9_SALNM|nr:zinc finger protein 385A-like isoform X1 [Salvelinus namaycush]
MIQPHLDMKPFLQFPMDTAPPQHSMGLFHNFNTMDPVQKAVINHTFGVPLVKTKRPIISCNVCQIRFNSESQAEAHYKGNRHARRVKGIETSKSRPQEGDKSSRPVPLNSSPSLPGESPTSAPDISDPCNPGTKHKTILEARSGLGPIKAYPRLGLKHPGELGGGPLDPNTEERTFHCEICNVRVNSELQLKQHISSRRHRDGVAGKPNPLLSRHKKHRVADLTSSLNFSKDLSKCLGAGLLPSPLAVAAAMAAAASSNHQLAQLRAAAASSAQHHPHHHHHHHLLQGPPLSHAILRPAPGPMRTSHVPILFSPY